MDAGAPAPASGVRKRRRGGRVGKIDIEDVSFAYEDVALEVPAGQFLCVIGHSGG